MARTKGMTTKAAMRESATMVSVLGVGVGEKMGVGVGVGVPSGGGVPPGEGTTKGGLSVPAYSRSEQVRNSLSKSIVAGTRVCVE
ncbi:MAG TPA: hypothetical protein PKX17_05705 [Candidatus Methanomethylicus sp.]|nr:hypothetical protein [Candidatus Methanomethylicus sp.]